MPTSPDKLLTVSEVSKLLSLRPESVRKLISEGNLRAYRIGTQTLRIPADAVADVLKPATGGEIA